MKPALVRGGSGRCRLADDAREEFTEPPRDEAAEEAAEALRELAVAAAASGRGEVRCNAAWRCFTYAVGSKRELLGARWDDAEPAERGRVVRAGAGDGDREER